MGDREASDLEDQEYENTDDNYNSDSEDDDYNEFVRPRRSVSWNFEIDLVLSGSLEWIYTYFEHRMKFFLNNLLSLMLKDIEFNSYFHGLITVNCDSNKPLIRNNSISSN